MFRSKHLSIAVAAILAGTVWAVSASADPVVDFYRGKRITFVVSVPPGGGYDVNARVLAAHIGKHMPGNPTTLVQNMPGAGGTKAANHMYNVAAKDGTVVCMPLSSLVLAQLLRPKRMKFKAQEFNWIGTITSMTDVLVVWHTAGVKTLAEAKRKPVIVGTSSKNSMGYQEPALINALVGTKFQHVFGYRGGAAMNLAMQQGEIQGRTNQWASWRVQKPTWFKEGKIFPIIQIGAKNPRFPNVPALGDLVKSKKDRELVDLIKINLTIGRSIYATPGVPAARVAALRKAFSATMKDPAFIADAKKRNVVINPMDGRTLQAYIEKSLKTPKSVVANFQKALKYK